MKKDNVLDILKGNSLVIPYVLLKNYKTLGINEKELLLLSYLMNYGEKQIFNIELISNSLCFEISEAMGLIGSLVEKKLVSMSVEKNKNGLMIEYLNISVLYAKLLDFITKVDEEPLKTNIYEVIEKEFGRTLSPIEYETIKGWVDASLNEELIKEALKEAVLNGVNNLKYIDKILYEWNKKGYKTPNDIKRKKSVKKEEVEVDLFDYNWIDDNEE